MWYFRCMCSHVFSFHFRTYLPEGPATFASKKALENSSKDPHTMTRALFRACGIRQTKSKSLR
jgi:hypothetical protein